MLYRDHRRIARDRIVDAEIKMLELRIARRRTLSRPPALPRAEDPHGAADTSTTRPGAGA
ncbi:MAG TPA: hypothetical protein VI318_03665 [Baekduia sp.]